MQKKHPGISIGCKPRLKQRPITVQGLLFQEFFRNHKIEYENMTLYLTKPFKKRCCRILTLLLTFFFTSAELYSQNDEEQIREVRAASNQALKSYQSEKVLSLLTEDILTTTGNGSLLAGKESLRNYIQEAGPTRLYWIRTPESIEVNKERGLAWETGTWKGYDPGQGKAAVFGGNYAAMWTNKSGLWCIKSQLFVTLK